jgi:type 1 fimbria pilin
MPQAEMVITGVVIDAAAKPVANARLYFADSPVALPDIAALSDEAGRFALSVPAFGIYTLECAADEYHTEKVRVTVGGKPQAPVTVALTRRSI